MSYQEEDKALIRRQRSKEAIALVMQSRWEEAVAVNRSIIESFPTDIDAYNRLGRALMELGEYVQAREAYSQALALNPNNSIARKNLDRLSHLKEAQSFPVGDHHEVTPHLFIEEVGKAAVVALHRLAPKDVLAKMVAGTQVYLEVRGTGLIVKNSRNEYLGEVEPRHGLRLIKLMDGGNEYAAAVISLGEGGVKVMIREVFQHPSQVGRLSFPLKATEGFRPYVKDSLLRHGLEEGNSEEEYPGWEEEVESLPGGAVISDIAAGGDEVDVVGEE